MSALLASLANIYLVGRSHAVEENAYYNTIKTIVECQYCRNLNFRHFEQFKMEVQQKIDDAIRTVSQFGRRLSGLDV